MVLSKLMLMLLVLAATPAPMRPILMLLIIRWFLGIRLLMHYVVSSVLHAAICLVMVL